MPRSIKIFDLVLALTIALLVMYTMSVRGGMADRASPSPSSHGPIKGKHTGHFGVNVSPSYRPWQFLAGPEPDSWWCKLPNCWNGADPSARMDQELSYAQQLGVSLVRMEFPWRFIETANGVYDWSRADAIVNAANAAGVQLQPVLVWTPAWISANDPAAIPAPADFQAFTKAIATRYKGSIHYWEIWNEPNQTRYWGGNVASYTHNLLIPGYTGIKSADPSAQVILAGPSSLDRGWLQGIYANGGGNSFDVLAFHDYSTGSSYDPGSLIRGDAYAAFGILSSHGQSGKPIWVGEFGYDDPSAPNLQDTGRQQLIRSILTNPGHITMAEYYGLRDTWAMNGNPVSVAANNGNWGLVEHDDITLKDSFQYVEHLLRGPDAPRPKVLAILLTPTLPTSTPAPPMHTTVPSTGVKLSQTTVVRGAAPVHIITTVSSASGSVRNGIIDIEVYNAANQKMGQRYFSGQNIAPGQGKIHNITWTPPKAGAYRVSVGVFGSGWSSMLFWANNAATIRAGAPTSTPGQR